MAQTLIPGSWIAKLARAGRLGLNSAEAARVLGKADDAARAVLQANQAALDAFAPDARGPTTIGVDDAVGGANRTFDFGAKGSGNNLIRFTSVDGTKIRINTGHVYNRTHSGGDVSAIGTMDEVESAILRDILANSRLSNLVGKGNQHSIQVNGHTIIYELSETPFGPVISNYYPPIP